MTRDDLDRLFLMAEASYFSARGEAVSSAGSWENCVSLSAAYASAGGTKNVHVYLNFALNSLGRIREAFDSCLSGLRIDPGNEYLLANLKMYLEHLSRPERQPLH